MQRRQKTLKPQRRTFRVPRVEPSELKEVLLFVNNPIEPFDESKIRSNVERIWNKAEEEESDGEDLESSKEEFISRQVTKAKTSHEAKRVIRTVFDRIVRYSDEIENTLADSGRSPRERVLLAKRQSLNFVTAFKGVSREFNVRV